MRSDRFSARICLLALVAFPYIFTAETVAAYTNVSAIPILRVGDPYPGRPGEFVADRDVATFATAMPDPSGILSIVAPHGSSVDDMITHNRNNGALAPLAQAGLITAEGFRLDQFGSGPVVRNASGQTIATGFVLDIPTDNTSPAIMSVTPAGAVKTIIAVNYPVPHHPTGVFQTIFLFGGVLGGNTYNLNDNGRVAWESVFKIGDTQHLGVYNWTNASGMTRIIDDTQPVPGHTDADWVDLVVGVADSIPFEPIRTQLTNADETIFRGRFKIGETLHRALYRGSSTGLSAIVDPARGDQVPGRPPGTGFFSILDEFYATRDGNVAFTAISTGSFDRGVYLQRPGQAVVKIRDNEDPIPTVPAGTRQTFVELKAMNENADTVITSLFGTGTDARQALMTCKPDGTTKLIARADQFPGVPSTTGVSFLGPDAINDNGDVLASVEFFDGRGAPNFGLYAYLAAEDQFVRVMGQGDLVDGMELIQFRLFVPGSSGGFGGTFADDRSFVAALQLRPLDAAVSGADDVWGLYDLTVTVPEPAMLSAAILISVAAARLRTRRPSRHRRSSVGSPEQ